MRLRESSSKELQEHKLWLLTGAWLGEGIRITPSFLSSLLSGANLSDFGAATMPFPVNNK
jgi:hypothetical protein